MEIKENEVSINMYAQMRNLTKSSVYNLIARNAVKWRYIFPETKEYIVIEKDSYTPAKAGRKKKNKENCDLIT